MTEQLGKLKKNITEIQGIMIKVSTGRGDIDDFEDEYRQLYFSIKDQLKLFRDVGINFPDLNFFSSLWDFYSYWKAGLKTYQERREYVRSMYKSIDDTITQSLMRASTRTINPNELNNLLTLLIDKNNDVNESMSVDSLINKPSYPKLEKQSALEYDVALSFAGEDREYAEELANALRGKANVFYDGFETAKLWGEDLYVYLSELYAHRARYCIMFLSEHYANKLWTNHERKAAQSRAFRENNAYILPIRLDSTEIPGIPETVGYLNWHDEGAEKIASYIFLKLGKIEK
jgi:hypothetical protein